MILLLLKAMRPSQWTKNLLIFAALFFSNNLSNDSAILTSAKAFIIFCLAASSIYLINDIIDIKEDRNHPLKKNRPIASGRLNPSVSGGIAAGCLLFSVIYAFMIRRNFGYTILIYIVLQMAYFLFLKRKVIFDVLSVSFGFVIRAVAGAEAIAVVISPWLFICTFLLALFIILGKRRAELTTYREAAQHRKILEEYSPRFLDQMISIATASTLVAYSIYTLSERTIKEFGTTNLVYTIPFVIYGIFRYLYLIYKKAKGDYPETILLTDIPLLIDVVLYSLAVMVILYIIR
jgi:4-hydroxybenzoate polyprenyltransferase